METNLSAANVLPVLIPPVVLGLTMLRRYRQLAGPQLLNPTSRRRLMFRPVVTGVLALLVLALPHPLSGYLAALLGALAGAGLAYWSAHHTRYEFGADGQATRYIPNSWIGGGILLLLIVRLLWKMWPMLGGQGHFASGAAQEATAHAWSQHGFGPTSIVGSSPLTTALFLLFMGYQIVYPLLVLRAAQRGSQHL